MRSLGELSLKHIGHMKTFCALSLRMNEPYGVMTHTSRAFLDTAVIKSQRIPIAVFPAALKGDQPEV